MAFLLHDIRLQKIRPLWWTTTYISPKAKTIQSSVLTHFTSGVTNVTVRIDIKNKTKKEFKLNLQTGVCTWFDLWSSQVTMGSSPVWTCISIHFSGTLLKKVWVYMRESSDIKLVTMMWNHGRTADALGYVLPPIKNWWPFCSEQLQRQIIYQSDRIFKKNWLIPSPLAISIKI